MKFDFIQSSNDHSLFMFHRSESFLILLVYVDDVVLTGSDSGLIEKVKHFMHS